MIALTNSVTQTVAVQQQVLFDTVYLKTGCSECHRSGTGSVKMRGNGIYDISFSANINGPTTTTPIQLSIYAGGEPIPGATMATMPSADGAINVATTIPVANYCCDFDRITVVNTGTQEVSVNSPMLYVRRRG